MKTLALTAILVIIISGCGESNESITPTVPTNKPPVIDRLILPTQVEANTPVNLQVIARDPDKDKLSIIWEVSEGSVNDDVWTPPNRATQVEVSVHITDGINPTVSLSKGVVVIKTEAPPPIAQQPPQPVTQNPPVAQEPIIDANLITPGTGAAGIKIGDKLNKVKKLYGNPIQEEDDIFIFRKDLLILGVSIEQDAVFILTLAGKGDMKTRGGNGLGSHWEKVRAEFGRPDEMEFDVDKYWKQGISFYYDDHLEVDLIFIYAPVNVAPAGFINTGQYEQILRAWHR